MVDLGRACPFVALAASGITNVSPSNITGDMGMCNRKSGDQGLISLRVQLGVYPISIQSVTGFDLQESVDLTYCASSILFRLFL